MTDELTVAIDLRLAGYRTAGVARYAMELAQALRASDEVRIIGVRSRRNRHSQHPDDIVAWTPPHHRIETMSLGLEISRKLPEIDLYHAPDFIAPRWLRVPRIATVHDLAFLRWPHLLTPDSGRYYRQIFKARSWTKHWIVPSEWTRGEMIELLHVPKSDISVVPHGVPGFLDGVEPLPREERRGYLLAVGTIEPRKRYDLLLDSIDQMEDQPWLVIAGAPGWQSDETAERLRSHPAVDWRPTATDADLVRYYQRARALVVPSLDEGFGLTALEAMACGTPVVSSGAGALPEVTGPISLTPDQDTPEAWAAALSLILEDDRLWDELSRASIARATQFSWQAAAEATIKAYQTALDH